MPHDHFFESDPNEKLSYDLVWLGDMTTEDHAWLRDNGADVCRTIHAGLNSEAHYTKTIETILALIGLVVTADEWKSWFTPVADIVAQHPISEGNLFQTGFCEVIGDFRELAGVYGKLDSAPPALVNTLLQAYIKLVKVVIYKQGLWIQQTLLEQAQKISQKLGDPIESSRLNHLLALYYVHYGDADLAEPYAKKAFNDSEFIDDPAGIVDAALTMGIIYRGSRRFDRAEYYIKRAIKMVPGAKRDKRFATLFYEYALVCYQHDKFELALSYYERALAIYEEYAAVYQITMTHHAMAQAYIYLGDFAKAESLIYDVRSEWEKLGNQYEWVNTFFVEADLELKRGNHSLGMRMLHQTIDRATSTLEDTPARDKMISLLNLHIDQHS